MNYAGKLKSAKSFTLLEVLVLVALIAIILAIGIFNMRKRIEDARLYSCFSNVRSIESMVDSWYIEKGIWPADNLGDIGADRTYFRRGLPRCPVTGVSYGLDSSTHRISGHDTEDVSSHN